MKKLSINILFALALLSLSSCESEMEQEIPSYLKIDNIVLVDNPSDSWSQESGFFTHDIDAVNIVVWQDGDAAETELGTFQLPCQVPLLKKGNMDRVRILPVIKQNGIAGTRIYYPYYEAIRLTDIPFAEDSVTDFGTLQTHYVSKSEMKVLWQEYFEPGPSPVKLDTVVQRLLYKADTVLSGYGCGVVRLADSVKVLNFWSDTTINISDPTSVVYLEMDYWSDFDFSVGLKNPSYQNGNVLTESAMTIYGKPQAGWQKIYINLGKLWARTYRYYPDIRLYFSVFNPNGKTGSLYIDNMKLVVL